MKMNLDEIQKIRKLPKLKKEFEYFINIYGSLAVRYKKNKNISDIVYFNYDDFIHDTYYYGNLNFYKKYFAKPKYKKVIDGYK